MFNKNIRTFFLFFFTSFFYFLSANSILAGDDPITGTWRQEQSFPYPICCEASLYENGRLYVMGGGGYGIVHTDVHMGLIENNEQINSWEKVSELPEPLFWHSSVKHNQNIYILGGAIESVPAGNPSSVDTVYKASINDDGSLSSWTTTTSLPERLALGEAKVYGNKIYYFGGVIRTPYSSIEVSQKVFSAPIMDNGELGVWSELTSLPEPRYEFSLFQSANKFIIVGGATEFANVSNDVISTEIDNTGELSSWQFLEDLPLSLKNPLFIQTNDYLMLLGGYDGNNFINTMYYSYLGEGGTPSGWSLSNTFLPNGNCCTSAVFNGSRIYLIGGHDGNYYDTIYSISISLSDQFFDLPFQYPGRPNATETQFQTAFWERLTAAFDHQVKGGTYIPFTGNSYKRNDCPNGALGITCYDSHNGTDFTAYTEQPDKNTILSIGNGTVVYTSAHTADSCTPNNGGYGCVVVVEYPDQEVYALYAHLSKIQVDENDPITTSSVVGVMGNTGCGKCGKHLHLGILKPLVTTTPLMGTIMTKKDWEHLVYQMKPNNSDETKYKSQCTYTAPNGLRFTFQDPTGWNGTSTDPWSLSSKDNGCGVSSPYLWKHQI